MNEPTRNFDQEAATWDDNPVRVKLAGEIAEVMKQQIAFTPDMDVLDIGCGTGLVTLALAPLARSITGADTSSGMLDVLTAKANRQNLTHVRTMRIQPEGGLTGRYDVIVSSMTFHHIQHIDRQLSECFQLLKAPGYLCIADLDTEQGEFHPDHTGVFHHGFNRDTLKQQFLQAGFTSVTDCLATEVTKPSRSGDLKTFTIFLMTGTKPRA